MEKANRHKYFVHYSLIVCTIFIQVIILLFFYNEYFNGKKLNLLEKQIQEAYSLNGILESSKENILSAQVNLQNYIKNNEKESLEDFFLSLKNLHRNLDSIEDYRKENLKLEVIFDSLQEEPTTLSGLQVLIDSIYDLSKKSIPKSISLPIESFEIEGLTSEVDINIEHRSDSIPPKKLLARLRDAFANDVAIKKEITIITTKYGDTLNRAIIKNMIDSIIEVVNTHYLSELEKYQAYYDNTYYKFDGVYKIYDQLISISNKYMEVYSVAITDFEQNLEAQYAEQNSKTNKIRKYTVLGLMILMFLVLAVIIYYTRQAFLFEKKLQEANRIIKMNLTFKNRILGMLSHEIRSPLRIINLFIDKISQKIEDSKINEYLSSIKFTNNSLLIQANQILEYAKNQEKKIELINIRVDLKREIDAILNAFQPYIEYKNNIFKLENEIQPNTFVFADHVKIHQVFMNILGNANKFTENGKVSVNVKTQAKNNLVRLYVVISDTGTGISESDLQKIFEPYYQGMVSDEIENVGAGIGLNLCKEIIDSFGGEITVESSLGIGTTVTFKIDLNRIV
jgi:signal transduction histidine kinase